MACCVVVRRRSPEVRTEADSVVQQAKQALGDRLRELRLSAGLTGRDLADSPAGISSKVSKIEDG